MTRDRYGKEALPSRRPRCEGCQKPAPYSDSEGVPLCADCYISLLKDEYGPFGKLVVELCADEIQRWWKMGTTRPRTSYEYLRSKSSEIVRRAMEGQSPMVPEIRHARQRRGEA